MSVMDGDLAHSVMVRHVELQGDHMAVGRNIGTPCDPVNGGFLKWGVPQKWLVY